MMTHEEEMALRKYVWLNHGHHEALYGDDGEMQCPLCGQLDGVFDYKRDTVANILQAAMNTAMRRAAEAYKGSTPP